MLVTTQLRRCQLSYQVSYPCRRPCMLLPHQDWNQPSPVLNQGDQGENLIPPSLMLIPDIPDIPEVPWVPSGA